MDDRGRIYIPKDVREGYGNRFRIVELKSGIKLIPLSEDPVKGLREAAGGELDDLELEEVDEIVEEEVRREVMEE
ncbi:MAG: AbrB/MazE/SpoVT family DNA-binding domain-containing protein [Candidatus Nanohaloarchaea archaeon]